MQGMCMYIWLRGTRAKLRKQANIGTMTPPAITGSNLQHQRSRAAMAFRSALPHGVILNASSLVMVPLPRGSLR
jgi:hypothetical protein